MSNRVLPKGYFPNDWNDWSGDYTWWTESTEEVSKDLTKRCTCGTNITLGYEVPPELHQDYCDLIRKDSDNGETG